MRVYSATDVGQKRKMNQDYVFVSKDPVGNLPNLFVVADGMGGHNAGDFASSHAVQILVDEIRKDADFNPIKVLRHAIETANMEILERAQQDEALKGMGTTMVVATIVGHYAYVANVGDSRLYLIQGQIRQVTRDHSLVQEMVRMGELKPEEAWERREPWILISLTLRWNRTARSLCAPTDSATWWRTARSRRSYWIRQKNCPVKARSFWRKPTGMAVRTILQ